MSEDPPASATTTAGRFPAAGLLTGLFSSPTNVVVVLALLGFGGANVAQLSTRGEDPAAVEERMKTSMEAEIAQVKQDSEDRALLKTAAECSVKVTKLTDDLDALGNDLRARDDDKFAFMAEITDYVKRLAAKLLKDPLPLGPRLNEFVNKGVLRGVRGGK